MLFSVLFNISFIAIVLMIVIRMLEIKKERPILLGSLSLKIDRIMENRQKDFIKIFYFFRNLQIVNRAVSGIKEIWFSLERTIRGLIAESKKFFIVLNRERNIKKDKGTPSFFLREVAGYRERMK